MNPEELLELLRKAVDARRRGIPVDKINERISAATNGEIVGFKSLAVAARDAGARREDLGQAPPAPAQEPKGRRGVLDFVKGLPQAGADALVLAGAGGSLGALDEFFGGLAGAGALLPGGASPAEAFRQEREHVLGRVQRARDRSGFAAPIAEIAGGIAAPGAAGARLAFKGASALTRAARGAGIGAGEAGFAGAATAEGSIPARLRAARVPAALGGVLGAVVPAAADATRAVRAGRRAIREEPKIGRQLGSKLRDESGLTGRPSTVRAEIRSQQRKAFAGLDEIESIPDAKLQAALGADDVKSFVPREVATGTRPPSFPEAQGALRQVRKAKDRALNRGDVDNFRKLVDAERDLGEALTEAVDGFGDANKIYAKEAARSRALKEGGKLSTKLADEVQEAFDALKTEPERLAFREGLGSRFLQKFDDIKDIQKRLTEILEAPETRAKLRIVLGDGFDAFEEAARQAQRTRNRAKAARQLQKLLVQGLGLTGALGTAGAVGSLVGG